MVKTERLILTYMIMLSLTGCIAPSKELAMEKNADQKNIQVLIVDGFSNHDWKQTTAAIRQILTESTLDCTLDVTTAPGSADSNHPGTWQPDFSKYNVVIQNTNNINNKQIRWPKSVQNQLENYVRSGGRLYIFHSANNAFDHWHEYDRMIGLGWRNKDQGTALEITPDKQILRITPGKGQNTSHGPRVDTVVHRLNEHPINHGFPKQWKTPSLEIYTYARGPAENLTVLSYAYDEPTKKYWPIEWIVQYGKGYVYNSTFGHLWHDEKNPPAIRCIGFQTTLVRSIEWLATDNVTTSIPPDFPTQESVSLK